MSTKHTSMFPASGGKKNRKVITDAPQLMTGLYSGNVSVLSTLEVDLVGWVYYIHFCLTIISTYNGFIKT